ncbi:MAG: Hsp20/alpha crystallin family protein [Bacteroidota bacterium]
MFPTRRSSSPLMTRFFDDDWPSYFSWRSHNGTNGNNSIKTPSVNVREKADAFIVEVAAPGMKKEDFEIELDDNVLTIRSEKRYENEENENDRYTSREFSYSSFERSFNLNNKVVDDANIKASYEDGILTLNVPKREAAKVRPPRMIEIA